MSRVLMLLVFLEALLLAPGCGPIIEVHCADPDAHPVFSRDDAGELTYEGCKVEDGSADGEVEK
jgi:hypothetical protein